MKQNPKSAEDTNVTIQSNRIVKVREILTKQPNQTKYSKCARYWDNNPIRKNSKSARDTNVTIQSNRILKVRKILT